MTDLVIVDEPSFDASSDVVQDAVVEASTDADADADVSGDELTITVDRPEATYLTTAGDVDRVTVGDVVACTGAACVETVKVRVPRGMPTTITFTVTAPNSAHFLSPASCKTTPTCTVSPADGPPSVKLRVVRHNYVFVTRETYAPTFGSLAAADAICAQAASTEGLPGTYRAWLSDSTADARSPSRLGNAGGFIRMDGRPFADTVLALSGGKVFYPIQLDPSGTPVDPKALVFTGTSGLGDFAGNACQNWQVRSGRYAAAGWAYGGTGEWTNHDRVLDCATNDARLYCFRSDQSVPLALRPPPTPHRTAFVSTPFTPSGGRAAMDQRCQNEASSALLTTNGQIYVAWVATTDKAPPSPLNTSALSGGWYRPDGLPVFSDPTLLRHPDGNQIANEGPLAQHADQSYVVDAPSRNTSVWTGMSLGPNAAAPGLAFTCNDWTSAGATEYAPAGNAGFGNPTPTGNPPRKDGRGTDGFSLPQPCDLPRSVYCLQQ